MNKTIMKHKKPDLEYEIVMSIGPISLSDPKFMHSQKNIEKFIPFSINSIYGMMFYRCGINAL
ncbi:MAG: hypothetical protein M3Z01_03520 [Thermoproteota archaeon]|nr:hypothetical protein [Thermoproteota archaeon]